MPERHDSPAIRPGEPESGTESPLEILYRDQCLVAVNKPSGLLVHRTRISRDREFLLQRLRNQLGRHVHPVHRLDRATSGVMLFALDPDSASAAAQAFQEGRVDKKYVAVVRGYADPAGTIDHAIKPEEGGQARRAVSHYSRLATVELDHPVGRYRTARYSLVAVRPETGRRHQIRRHFEHISHPVVGDTTHGDGRHNRFFREQFGIWRLLLHAWSLDLAHPATGEPLTLRAEPTPEFQGLLDELGWQLPDAPPAIP